MDDDNDDAGLNKHKLTNSTNSSRISIKQVIVTARIVMENGEQSTGLPTLTRLRLIVEGFGCF